MVKVVIGLKDGKCVQKEVADASALMGKVIGDKVEGASIGFNGYEFLVTGGSDDAGFPMNTSIAGVGRKRILAVSSVGLRKIGRGVRVRKTVCGNTIHAKIVQVNLKVLKEGPESLLPPPAAAEEKKE